MPHYKLRYFDMHGGRGEPARLAMSIGNIPFEDDRIPISDWPAAKDSTPFGKVPVLEVDGQPFTQGNSISRYIGRLTDLYPDDPLEALRCDEVMDAVDEVVGMVVPTMFLQDEDEKRKAREKLAAGPIPLYLRQIAERLERGGGEHFAACKLTVADLKVMVWIRFLRSGNLDYVPRDLVDQVAPNLAELQERVAAHPGIVAWYEAH